MRHLPLSNHLPELSLCFVTMLWGATFLVIRLAMEECGPLLFVGLRFGTAAAVLFLLTLPQLRDMTTTELFGGCLLGVIVFLGFALQTAGLSSLDAAKSAFLTAFYVPLVPLLEWLFFRRRPSARALAGLGLAFVGVLLISGGWNISLEGSRGELLTLLCSLLFALEIVCTGIFAPRCNTRRLTLVVLTVTALLACALIPVTGETIPDPIPTFVLLAAAGLGVSTALIQSIIVWAQKSLAPSRATLIYSTEPVWGGFFGYLGGERLGASALAGCGLILSALVLDIFKRKAPAKPDAGQNGGES